MYIIIGVVISISLLIFYSSGQVWAFFPDSNWINYDMHFNDDLKIFVRFPDNWTGTENAQSVMVSGNGAELVITPYRPTPGSYFPDINTPVEQIANNIIKVASEDSPNLRLTSHRPLFGYDAPAYQLSFSEEQAGVNSIHTDILLFITGGSLYEVTYTVPVALYQQNFPIEHTMIQLMRLGLSYDNFKLGIAPWQAYIPPLYF